MLQHNGHLDVLDVQINMDQSDLGPNYLQYYIGHNRNKQMRDQTSIILNDRKRAKIKCQDEYLRVA